MNPIEIYDNYIPDCNLIIDFLETQMWKKSGITVDNIISEYRTSSTAVLPFLSYSNPDCVAKMNKLVWTALDNYAKKWDFSFSDIENISIQKYEIGQYYKKHFDSDTSYPRVVSAIVYLNTVDEGGETVFPLQNESIKPIEGRLAIFPSNYVFAHEALTPISNVKYAAAFWAKQ